MKFPKVSIVILNWNNAHYTIQCIESLRQMEYPNYEIIVVDNGSENNDCKMIEEKFGNSVYLIENEKNLGYAGGNNKGIKYALNSGADYLFLLNNDTLIKDRFTITKFLVTSQEGSNIGIIGCRLISPDGDLQLYQGEFLRPLLGGKLTRFFYPKTNNLTLKKTNKPIDVDAICGAAMFIKVETLKEVGFFDEIFFPGYGEEIDLCFRFRKKGYRVLYLPSVEIIHLSERSSRMIKDEYLIYVRLRNLLRLILLHFPLIYIILSIPYLLKVSLNLSLEGYMKSVLEAYKEVITKFLFSLEK